ncbi:potassium transporter TrkG [Deinococcus sp.]|uniref:potassium transporter TrkG n=1 Tax=Deinococcus sp. TaxID=47478 RepID=UPI0025BA72A7|nr:potassium transporter TrkG [Deinococcus sp.]
MSSGSATDAPANGRDFPVAIRSPNDWLIVWVLVALLVGTLGLLLPAAHQGHLSLIDALLLATSAVCTTGLSSVNVGQVLTPAGQLWLAVLIEVGALALLVLILRFVGWGKQAAAAD